MKRIILFVAFILFGNNAISQTQTYLLFEFMKVAPEQESAYLETENFWEKVHDQRIKSGEIMSWELWRMDLRGVYPDYQYVTVQVFNDSIKMFQGKGESFLAIAKKAFPDRSEAELLSTRTESLKNREVADLFYLKQIDRINGKSDLSLGALMAINLMKVTPNNYAKYENAESKIFKPEWQNRVNAGATDSWSLLKVISAKENGLNPNISYLSLDKFQDYNQYYGVPYKNPIRSKGDEEAWMEAFNTREIKSYRAVLIKKKGKGI